MSDLTPYSSLPEKLDKMPVRAIHKRTKQITLYPDAISCLKSITQREDYDLVIIRAKRADVERFSLASGILRTVDDLWFSSQFAHDFDTIPFERAFPITRSLTELRLVADQIEWLLPHVEAIKERKIGAYTVVELADYGADTVVLKVRQTDGQLRAMKMPWHAPSKCESTKEMAKRRARVELESRVLRAGLSGLLPEFVELFYDRSYICTKEYGPKIPYLVEEWIEGDSPSIYITKHGGGDDIRKRVALRCAWALFGLQTVLLREAMLYTDIKERNILISDAQVRLVDAGSAANLYGSRARRPMVTLVSLCPPAYEMATSDPEEFYLTETEVVRMCGRVLSSLITGDVLVPGESTEAPNEDGSEFHNLIRDMLNGVVVSFQAAMDRLTQQAIT